MLNRTAVALGFLLAACSRTTDYSDCRLVGRWVNEFSVTNRTAEVLREQGRDPAQVQNEQIEKQRADGSGEFFLADGTYIMRGFIFEHPFENTGTWSVVSDVGDRISIAIPDPKEPT